MFIRYRKAPLGHCFTCATIASVLAPFASIHGRSPGLNTLFKFFQQMRLCWHSSASQMIVTSPFEYSWILLMASGTC